jgi:signal transduction histidine kinase
VLSRVLRHNIRNELTIILGRLDMKEAQDRRLDATVVDDLNRIERAAHRILRIAEKARRVDRFDLSQEKETRNVTELLGEQIETLAGEYPEVEIETDLPEYVPAPTYGTISIAFYELLENASIHNDAAEKRISISIDTSLASTAEVTIRDNGPGIRQAEVKPILQETETPLEHGSSIGLWLTRWVVNDHGGELEITGDASGTTARITLPIEPLNQLRSNVRALGE